MDEYKKHIDDKPPIKVLVIEDDEGHAELICNGLSKAKGIHFDTERAGLISSGIAFLGEKKFDVILSDLGLPDSVGVKTFKTLHGLCPDIPVIVLTALDDENTALSAVQSGAQDYLVKGRIDTSQLIRSIRYAIERQKLISELEKRIKEIKTLQGLLPVCAWCKNIRDDKGYWKNLEAYVEEHTDAAFTHGICPKCMEKVERKLYEKIGQENLDLQEKQEQEQDEKRESDDIG